MPIGVTVGVVVIRPPRRESQNKRGLLDSCVLCDSRLWGVCYPWWRCSSGRREFTGPIVRSGSRNVSDACHVLRRSGRFEQASLGDWNRHGRPNSPFHSSTVSENSFPSARSCNLLSAVGTQPLGNCQFEIHPALRNISCARSVNCRFSFVMLKFSNCARSRIVFNFATRATYFCRETPDSRFLTRSSIVSILAVRRQTTVFVAETVTATSSSAASSMHAPAKAASRQERNRFRRRTGDCDT